MNGLDPAVLAATDDSPAPPLDANLVVSVTPDERDPAWSTVEFADGRVENRPSADANAMPKVPPPAPMGPPLPPPVGAGQPVPGELGLVSVGDPVGQSNLNQDSLVSAVQGAAAGPGAGFQDLGVKLAPGEGPGTLPPAQVDPGATVVEPADPSGTVPYGETSGVTQTTQHTVADPAQLAADVSGQYQDTANALDANAQGVQDAAYAENQARLEQNAARQQQVADDLQKAEIHTQEAKRVVDAIESEPIEQDFFKDSPGRQVAAWVALALSGFLQGATKGANPALNQMMQSLNAAQDRFIANQHADKNSRLARRTKMLGDRQAAEATIRLQYGKLIDDHAQMAAKQVGLDALPPALSTASAQFRVKAVEAQQAIGMHVERKTEERFQAERRAAPAGPTFQGDRDLQALGVDRKTHAEAMDPKGLNLGGVVGGAQDMQRIANALKRLQDKDGNLAAQGTLSWSQLGLAPLAARWGVKNAEEQVNTRQLLEQAKLAFKQTINIKSVDSENEGKNFNAIMDSGDGATTVAAIQQKAAEANRNAIGIASGVSRNPQGYLNFIQRTLSSNPGVTVDGGAGPTPKRSTGYRVPTDGAADAGGGPATPPLAPATGSPEAKAQEANPATGSRRGTYRRLRESKRDEPR